MIFLVRKYKMSGLAEDLTDEIYKNNLEKFQDLLDQILILSIMKMNLVLHL